MIIINDKEKNSSLTFYLSHTQMIFDNNYNRNNNNTMIVDENMQKATTFFQ